MNVHLVTGGSGYLASRLIPRLDGEVHALVRPTSDTAAIDSISGVHVWRTDGSPPDMERIVREINPTQVFHLASCYRRTDRIDDVRRLVDGNITYGTTLLQALTRVNNPTFIHTGTFFEHYRNEGIALNLYAATKRAFGEIVRYHDDTCSIRTAKVTMYEIYGPSDPRPKFVNAVVHASTTGSSLQVPSGDPRLDFVYVDDAADALIAAADAVTSRSASSGIEWSATSGQSTPLSGVIELVETLQGRPIRTEIGAYPLQPRTITEPWRTDPPPGWVPQVGLEEGLAVVVGEFHDAR